MVVDHERTPQGFSEACQWIDELRLQLRRHEEAVAMLRRIHKCADNMAGDEMCGVPWDLYDKLDILLRSAGWLE